MLRAQIEEVKKDEERLRETSRTAVVESGFQMSHSAGFEAWLRNSKGLGKTGFFTADDLLRQARTHGVDSIEATESTSTPLPPLTATAVCFNQQGPPDEVLYVDRAHQMADSLKHGEVLVYMLAACVNEEDLIRVQVRGRHSWPHAALLSPLLPRARRR